MEWPHCHPAPNLRMALTQEGALPFLTLAHGILQMRHHVGNIPRFQRRTLLENTFSKGLKHPTIKWKE